MSSITGNQQQGGTSVSRRSLLRAGGVCLALAVGSAWLASCGGGTDGGSRSDDPSPTPTPQTSPSPVVLPQQYRLAYKFAGGASELQVAKDGTVFVGQGIKNEETDTFQLGISRYTNRGRPGESVFSVVRVMRFNLTNGMLGFSVSPDNEIYVPNALIGETYNREDESIAVLSTSGTILRKGNVPPGVFSPSGDVFTTSDETGVYRFGADGTYKNRVLADTSEQDGEPRVYFSEASLSPQGELWSYVGGDSFLVAKPDGSSRRRVRVKHEPNQGAASATRCDGAGELYTDALMPRGYPNHPDDGSGSTTQVPYIRKFDQQGNLLAAFPVEETISSSDFDVDAQGNVYVATENGVHVYERLR